MAHDDLQQALATSSSVFGDLFATSGGSGFMRSSILSPDDDVIDSHDLLHLSRKRRLIQALGGHQPADEVH